MIKLVFTNEADAQVMADRCHVYLVANSPKYQADVLNGWTVEWCKPSEEVDADGNGTGVWYIWVTPELSPLDPAIAALFPAQEPLL